MVVRQTLGNINFFALNNRKIDSLLLEWYETNKRILRKKTMSGIAVVMKFLNEGPQLSEGDVIYEDDFNIITIEIKACDSLIIRPRTMHEMAAVCYEIGNRHLPVFYQDEEILVAYEDALFNLFYSAGYDVARAPRKLVNELKTSVLPRAQGTLLSRIRKLTNPPE